MAKAPVTQAEVDGDSNAAVDTIDTAASATIDGTTVAADVVPAAADAVPARSRAPVARTNKPTLMDMNNAAERQRREIAGVASEAHATAVAAINAAFRAK